MKVSEIHPADQVFTHVDLEGNTRHFNTSALTRAIISKQLNPRVQVADLYPSLVEHLIANHGVELDHLPNITKTRDVPILMVEFDDGSNLIVDGSHRVVRRWQDGLRDVTAYVLGESQWKPFLVEDFDAIASLNIMVMEATKKERAATNAQRLQNDPESPSPYEPDRLSHPDPVDPQAPD